MLAAAEVGRDEVEAALAFFLALNDPARRGLAAGLPAASEACFSLADHFTMVESRIERLTHITPESDVDRQARTFVADMRARWAELKNAMMRKAGDLGIEMTSPLAPADRCVSPSDFGFHNALATRGGRLVFIDFEYAGWDDPAKAANDFFCQPAVPVDANLYDDFVARVMTYSATAAQLAVRAKLMRPIFQLKW